MYSITYLQFYFVNTPLAPELLNGKRPIMPLLVFPYIAAPKANSKAHAQDILGEENN